MKGWSIILLIVLCKMNPGFAGGFSYWEQSTPGGNSIFYDKGLGLSCFAQQDHRPCELKRWYFFKNHIIGEYFIAKEGRAASERIGYFVVDEAHCAVETFREYDDFKRYLKGEQLAPRFWVRWYDDTWGFFTTEEFGRQFGLMFLIPILVVFYLVLLAFVIFGDQFSLKAASTHLFLFLNALIGLRLLLDHYPQSF